MRYNWYRIGSPRSRLRKRKGKYVNSVWMCNECADVQKSESKNDQRESMVGVASASDVSPNTPKADEANL